MKYEIKQLNDTNAVIISDEETLSNNGDYFLGHPNYDKLLKWNMPEKTQHEGKQIWIKKVIATISPFELEGLPMIELPNQEEDVEKLAMDELKDKWGHLYQFGYPKKPYPTNYEKDLNLIMVGYSKAAQKQYSEDDMKKAIEMAQKFNVDTQYDEYDVMHESFKHIYSEEQIIQSLSTQQFPTSVELTEEEYCLPMPNIHVKKYKLKVIKWYYE